MKFENIQNGKFEIPPQSLVTLTFMGDITELQYMSSYNHQARTLKISNEEYVEVSTGEVKRYEDKRAATRGEAENSLRKTMRHIRQLIQTNITDVKNVRWVTLTYKENMTDPKKLYDDFRKFNQKFTYHLKECGIKKPEYICVAEPQKRGAWHLHVLFIWEEKAPYLDNAGFSKMWGHGFTKIKSLKSGDSIASYLQCYLTDLDIPDEIAEYFPDSLKETGASSGKKRVVKGARLHLYPAGFNILRHSRNIKKPLKKTVRIEKAMEILSSSELSYQKTFKMFDEKGFESIVDKREYKGS